MYKRLAARVREAPNTESESESEDSSQDEDGSQDSGSDEGSEHAEHDQASEDDGEDDGEDEAEDGSEGGGEEVDVDEAPAPPEDEKATRLVYDCDLCPHKVLISEEMVRTHLASKVSEPARRPPVPCPSTTADGAIAAGSGSRCEHFC